LGLVLSALLIKDRNSEENSKTYLIMLSLTIARLQGIIPKLMAFQEDCLNMQEGTSEDLLH
jgi:hypothetical protein